MLRGGLPADADFIFVVVHAEKSPRVGCIAQASASQNRKPQPRSRINPLRGTDVVEDLKTGSIFHFPMCQLLGVFFQDSGRGVRLCGVGPRRIEFVQLFLQRVADNFFAMLHQRGAAERVIKNSSA